MREIRFGDFTDTCQLCFKVNRRFGTLVDPVGRYWLLCVDCVKGLWEEKQALNQGEAEKERQEQAVDAALGKLRDLLIGNGELCVG
jgi:hypothetical protein